MLEPTSRHLFTDGLRPPSGFTVDLAVGTTYTLSLGSLLLPPLAMAAHDRETSDNGEGDTIALLEAVRRFAERMTVFCHAGAMHVPSQYRRILTFAEDSVVQVAPRAEGRVFHPKVWALRFTDGQVHRHRLLSLSRNLTADTSWDTIVQLDETANSHGIHGKAAGDFFRELPTLAVESLADHRHEQIADLASTIAQARFAVPEPFTRGELWPLGLGTAHGWPVPERIRRSVTISPFLDATTVARLAASPNPVFVSRPETYAELGAAAFAGADVRVLDPLTEGELGAESAPEADTEPMEATTPWEVRSGLHAKAIVWDYDGRGWCLVGSANATGAAFGGNVEFGVLLSGPRDSCGVEALLPKDPPSKDVGLGRILQPHTIPDGEPATDPGRAATLEIAAYHAALVGASPTLTAAAVGDDKYAATLSFRDALPSSPGTTTMRLLSKHSSQHALPIDSSPGWTKLELAELTPFVVVRTAMTVPGLEGPVAGECVLKVRLIGGPSDRPARILRTLLDSEDSVLRYLSFLLDDGGAEGWGLDLFHEDSGAASAPPRPTFDDLALLETLLRAAARGDESLVRVHSLLKDLTVGTAESTVVSADFVAVWEAVWAASNTSKENS